MSLDFEPTLPAATVFAVTDSSGAARAPVNAQALAWAQEIETFLNRVHGEYTAVTATATLDASVIASGELIALTAAAAAVTTTLPSAATAGEGYAVLAKRLAAAGNSWTIQRAGSDTIDGWATDFEMRGQYDWAILKSDGVATWVVVAAGIAPIDVRVTATNTSYALPAGAADVAFRRVKGGGGGAGNADGIATSNNTAATPGGGEGAEDSFVLDVTGLSTLSLTVGAAGAGAAAGTAASGTAGGASIVSWNAGASSRTAAGGLGSTGTTASSNVQENDPPAAAVCSTSGDQSRVRRILSRNGARGDGGRQYAGGGGRGGSGGGEGGGAGSSTPGDGAAATDYGCGGAGPRSTTNNASNYAGGNGFAGVVDLTIHVLRRAP